MSITTNVHYVASITLTPRHANGTTWTEIKLTPFKGSPVEINAFGTQDGTHPAVFNCATPAAQPVVTVEGVAA